MGRKISTTVSILSATGDEVPKSPGMNALLFYNRSASANTAYINGWPILYNQRHLIGGDQGDELINTYKVTFDSPGTGTVYVLIGSYEEDL